MFRYVRMRQARLIFLLVIILCIAILMLSNSLTLGFQPTAIAQYQIKAKVETGQNSFISNSSSLVIPTILHQSWKTHDLPAKFKAWRQTWIDHHPTWIHKLWTDDDNSIFVATYYPWFLKTFYGLKRNINRIDAVRYMYLHHYGGVYVDLDFESINPMGGYLKGKQLVLGRMGSDVHFYHSIPNAFMASVPGHPFWIKVLEYISENYNKPWGVEWITGPIMLFNVYNANSADPSITISDPEVFYPYSWRHHKDSVSFCSSKRSTFDSDRCKKKFVKENTLAITYWSHTWDGRENIFIKLPVGNSSHQ